MARVRIHQLAKQWGLPSKELTAQLEKIGIHGKRSQSSVDEEEVDRLTRALGRVGRSKVAIGEEREVTGSEGQRLVERRVGAKVIRRRAARSQQTQPAVEEIEPLEVLSPQGEVLEAFAIPEPVSEPVPEIVEEEPGAASVPEAETLPADAPVAETSSPSVIPTSEVETPSAQPAGEEVPADVAEPVEPAEMKAKVPAGDHREDIGPKIVGRIDLKKAEADRAAALGRTTAKAPGGRGRRLPVELPPLPDVPVRSGKRKKRRVIQKPEFAEIGQRERFRRMPRKKRAAPGTEQHRTEITTPKASKRVVRISDAVSVGDLAKSLGIKATEVVKKLMEAGTMASINQLLDSDTAALIAGEFGYTVENVSFDAESVIEIGHDAGNKEAMRPRAPVVTVMGHVDHGKTSILDAIRHTSVTEQEAGGITQHIGAYTVDVHGQKVTFLDTPGHEAFTSMRARGAKVTDIVVLVVAADDGVMPQTVEAINHAQAAGVPIVVAINKIDKPEANVDRIKQGLAEYNLVPEDWGGKTISVAVSAKTGEGLPQLLDMLLLQAEILELKANPATLARGTIVEAKLDRGRGPVATVLIREGTLKLGDPFVCGTYAGRVRAMLDDKGSRVSTAAPSTPVEILGLPAVPEAGAQFVVTTEEGTAKQVAAHRRTKHRDASLIKTSKVSLEDLYRQVQAGDAKELRVVVKADVQGSVEALSQALERLSTEQVRLNVLHASVGGITESDIMLAAASNAVVIGFNIRPETKAHQTAERDGVELRLYTVIYDALNEVRAAMEGLLEPTFIEKVVARVEVRETFSIPKVGTIAGCMVTEGKVKRNALARLVRDQVIVHEGRVGSLRRFKNDAREVQAGYECGVGLEDFNDVKVGDIVEVYEKEAVAAHLDSGASRGAVAEGAV